MNKINMENPVLLFFDRLGNIIILNLLFLLTCLPIITIGAATVALYSNLLKMVRNEEGYLLPEYFRSFKNNFRQSTIVWSVILAIGVAMGLNIMIVRQKTDTFSSFIFVVAMVILIFLYILSLYLFPNLAYFENSLKQTIKNAFLMSVLHFPYTLGMLVMVALAVVLSLYLNIFLVILYWLVVGFAALAYGNSFFFRLIFDKYDPNKTGEE